MTGQANAFEKVRRTFDAVTSSNLTSFLLPTVLPLDTGIHFPSLSTSIVNDRIRCPSGINSLISIQLNVERYFFYHIASPIFPWTVFYRVFGIF